MHYFKLLVIMTLYSSSSVSTEFKLNEFEKYGASPGIELALVPSEGFSAKEIFSVVNINRSDYTMRLIGISSDKTNHELLKFYKTNFSNELIIAQESSGNLHNPALRPLRQNYESALKSTSMYKELESELSKRGLFVKKVNFEKFTMYQGIISVPDTYIYVVSMPNKSLKQDK